MAADEIGADSVDGSTDNGSVRHLFYDIKLKKLSEQEWTDYLDSLVDDEEDILTEYFNLIHGDCNYLIQKTNSNYKGYNRWRKSLKIVLMSLTAIVAVLNVFAQNQEAIADTGHNDWILAALLTSILVTFVASIDSFFDFSGSTSSSLSVNHQYRSITQRYDYLWRAYVGDTVKTYKAYENALKIIDAYLSDIDSIRTEIKQGQDNNIAQGNSVANE